MSMGMIYGIYICIDNMDTRTLSTLDNKIVESYLDDENCKDTY